MQSETDRLKKVRVDNDLDQQQMGALLGMGKKSYQNLEGGGKLTADHLRILFNKYRVNANYLLFGVGPKYVPKESEHQSPTMQQFEELRKEFREEVAALKKQYGKH